MACLGQRAAGGDARGLVQLPLVMRTYRRYTPAALARSHAHHREIVDALRAGDGAWAESVMRSHVLAARRSCCGPSGEPPPGRSGGPVTACRTRPATSRGCRRPSRTGVR